MVQKALPYFTGAKPPLQPIVIFTNQLSHGGH